MNYLKYKITEFKSYFEPRYVKTWFEIQYWKIRTKLGYKFDNSVIPENTVYCYTPDIEKNKEAREKGRYSVYYTKPCPYFRIVNPEMMQSACTYMQWIGDDVCHWDQCKICGEKY